MEERRLVQLLLCCSLVGGLCAVSDAVATPISDRSFFDSIPHTFLDFETDGDGAPVDVPNGDLQFMNIEEYYSAGMSWNGLGTVFWGNPSDAGFEAALAASGSPNHVVGWSNGTAGMYFPSLTVRSVGFSLFVDTSTNAAPIIISAVRFDGSIIESVEFDASYFDGMIGDVAFGFVGFTLDEPVSDIVFFQTLGFAIDDLHFSSIPSPGGLVVLPLGGVWALRRRR